MPPATPRPPRPIGPVTPKAATTRHEAVLLHDQEMGRSVEANIGATREIAVEPQTNTRTPNGQLLGPIRPPQTPTSETMPPVVLAEQAPVAPYNGDVTPPRVEGSGGSGGSSVASLMSQVTPQIQYRDVPVAGSQYACHLTAVSESQIWGSKASDVTGTNSAEFSDQQSTLEAKSAVALSDPLGSFSPSEPVDPRQVGATGTTSPASVANSLSLTSATATASLETNPEADPSVQVGPYDPSERAHAEQAGTLSAMSDASGSNLLSFNSQKDTETLLTNPSSSVVLGPFEPTDSGSAHKQESTR